MGRQEDGETIVVRSPAMRHALQLVQVFSRYRRPIAFVGPIGVGKTTLAREAARLAKLSGDLVEVGAGELPESLFGDVLFGRQTSAFTGASIPRKGLLGAAGNGALLVDDLHRLPKTIQAALLRVLDTGRYRPLGSDREEHSTCRFFFGSAVPLGELERQDELLPDLLSRIGSFVVPVPPLKERREDILPLARGAAQSFSLEHGFVDEVTFSDDAAEHLERYDWPANVRELHWVVAYGFAMAKTGQGRVIVRGCHLPDHVRHCESPTARDREARHALIERALLEANGNQAAAARIAGVHRNTVRRYVGPHTPRSDS